MNVEIYFFITLGLVLGAVLRRSGVRIGRLIDVCLGGVIYCLVFLVGLNFGRVGVHLGASEHQALSIIQVGLTALVLAVIPALLSLLLAVILLRGRGKA